MSLPADDSSLLALARSVADGATVDWQQAESLAAAPQREFVRELEVIASLASAHRAAAEAAEPGSPSEAAPPPGSTWGPFQLEREIGRGRFGAVYVARDSVLHREVAVKVLHASENAEAVIEELRTLAGVQHPGVVTVYGVDRFDGMVGMWMELVGGLTVRQILGVKGEMGSQEAALIGIDLCGALEAVHGAGLVHRDITARNVMRELGGRIVLMDFGAGLVTADPPWPNVIDAPGCLAPELFDGAPATIAGDIYSLGVFLYHVLTLRYPVEGHSLAELRAAHARGAFVPITDRRPDLPSAIAQVVERALRRDSAMRHASAAAMQLELMNALKAEIAAGEARLPMVPLGAAKAPPPSVAVLPFENLGPDPDLDYFCSGLAEELLTALGKVAGLRVASRTSSLAVRQTDNADVQSICRRLGVSTVLEGTVRKAGDRLRIAAHLVSAADGCHLWSEGYDRQMADVFTVQEEIAQSVVDRLEPRLNALSPAPLVKRHTDNPRAYEHYLRGRFYWGRRYQGGLGVALEEFRKAIEQDAAYAPAQAGVADAYAFLGFYHIRPPRAAFARARAVAERALALDPELPEAHASLALVDLGDAWNFPAAEIGFRRAIELDPAQAAARIYLSWTLVLTDDIAGGLAEARRAQELDPLSTIVNGGAAHTLFMARRFEDAIVLCDRILEVDPESIVAAFIKAECCARQSRLQEGIELMEWAAAKSDRAPFYLALLGNFYAKAGDAVGAHAIIDELQQQATHRYVPPMSVAVVYAGLGDLDRAFEWEAKASEEGSTPFVYVTAVIDNMRADPRHTAAMRRMGWR
ncbi:MAG TPA: protein kinase [Vicinamibacterales bacterium]|nr:protein kinase [Vicinamibacterales bacterium]